MSLALVFIIIKTAVTHRNHAARSDRRYCKHCSAVYAANANFCGRCGKQFT
jgi:predicted amidophosphoribosyltransferase